MIKNKPSIIQKFIAIILIATTIVTFILIRTNTLNNIKSSTLEVTSSVENTIIPSFELLCNNPEADDINNYIYTESLNKLISKFSATSEAMSNSNLYISVNSLEKSNLYKKKIKQTKYYIYVGTIDYSIYSNTSKNIISTETKELTAYLLNDNDNFKIVDISLGDSKTY